MQNIIKSINQKLKQSPNESIKEIFRETRTVLSLKHPPNLKLLSINVIWYIRCHKTYHSTNVIYFLKCTSCNYSTMYIGKTVDLHSRMNNHIISCRLGSSTDKFDTYSIACRTRKKNCFFIH